MQILDVFTPFVRALKASRSLEAAIQQTAHLSPFAQRAQSWGVDFREVGQWILSDYYQSHIQQVSLPFLEMAPAVVKKVESILGVQELPGEIHLIPSLTAFDGFARYDSGHHTVLLGVDFPDASTDYLKVLTSHELSHVYRDHQPEVWGHLGKPLREITREEYLESVTAHEHLVSEGLATLFSQFLFPEIDASIHHYYEENEWQWCQAHHSIIEHALHQCLSNPHDQDVWRFYGEDQVAPGSPSRTQYYYASHRIQNWLPSPVQLKSVIEAHAWHADRFYCFGPVHPQSA